MYYILYTSLMNFKYNEALNLNIQNEKCFGCLMNALHFKLIKIVLLIG